MPVNWPCGLYSSQFYCLQKEEGKEEKEKEERKRKRKRKKKKEKEKEKEKKEKPQKQQQQLGQKHGMDGRRRVIDVTCLKIILNFKLIFKSGE
ncbi:hypothetical protein STEG23_033394 [Scotinomys teguina]